MKRLIMDPGNGHFKLWDGERFEMFPSVIGLPQETIGEQPLEIDGYFVGDDADRHSQVKIYSITDKKTEQRTLPILVKYALTLYPDAEEIVFLLPFDNFAQEKRSIQNMFEGTINIHTKRGDEEQHIKSKIKTVRALPQGLCAGMDRLMDEEGRPINQDFLRMNILILDIGRRDLNMIFLKNGSPIDSLCHTFQHGMIVAYRLLAAKKQRAIADIDLMDGFDALAPFYPHVAQGIMSDVETNYKRSDIHMTLLVGGGAQPLTPFLSDQPNLVLHPGQDTNVKGGLKVARSLWGVEKGHVPSVQTAK